MIKFLQVPATIKMQQGARQIKPIITRKEAEHINQITAATQESTRFFWMQASCSRTWQDAYPHYNSLFEHARGCHTCHLMDNPFIDLLDATVGAARFGYVHRHLTLAQSMELMERLWLQFPEKMKNSLLSVLFLHGPILHHQLEARHHGQDVSELSSLLQIPEVWHENMMKWLGYEEDGV
jgi:hypothetical protein